MPERRAPFIDPDHTDHRDRNITARWNQGPLNAEGWQRQSVLTVQHFVRRGYRATVSVSAVRHGDRFTEEDLGTAQFAVVLDVSTAARFSARQLTQVYRDALSALRRRIQDGDAALTAYFPQSTTTETRTRRTPPYVWNGSLQVGDLPDNPTITQADAVMRVVSEHCGQSWYAVKLSGWWRIICRESGVGWGCVPGQYTRNFSRAVAEATGMPVVRDVPWDSRS